MRALLPSAADDVDLHDFYGQDWLDAGGIRGNMLTSVDGAVTASGKSAGLQTPGDNRVFAVLRELADVVIVGSGTALVEGYRPVRFGEPALARRRARGLPDDLPIAVVTRSLRVDLSTPLFADPERRPIVVTSTHSDPAVRDMVSRVADVIVCGESEVDFGAVRGELSARNLRRVLCEGGPTVLARVVDQSQLDELCVSMTPLLAGPGPGRILSGLTWTGIRQLSMVGALEEDGALFLRYRARTVAR